MKHFDDINDDEIRLISSHRESRKPWYCRWWLWVIVVLTVAVLIVLLLFIHKQKVVHEVVKESVSEPAVMIPIMEQAGPAMVSVCDTTINDVALRLYKPINAVPELCLGIPDTTDSTIVLACQAADIRADNQKIVGAFVMKGVPLAWGLSKKGYCAILDGKIQIGMADNSPLFEEATEKEGYFFRQYPLVDKGVMVENKPKGKALRRALCQLNGQVVIITSLTVESFHDFAQALADLGVYQAIYLSGGSACGFSRGEEGTLESWGEPLRIKKRIPSNINFMVWKEVSHPQQD